MCREMLHNPPQCEQFSPGLFSIKETAPVKTAKDLIRSTKTTYLCYQFMQLVLVLFVQVFTSILFV